MCVLKKPRASLDGLEDERWSCIQTHDLCLRERTASVVRSNGALEAAGRDRSKLDLCVPGLYSGVALSTVSSIFARLLLLFQ